LSPSAVESVNVTKSFQDVQAVKGISLAVGEGQFFSLLGPSGCGKTTLLRMIAGFETPTTGQILVSGKDMAGVPPHKRPVNMVFQSYALFPHLTVFENVAFGLKVGKKCPSADISERVKEALSLVRLPHVAERYPRELSGGQQQRIAFARAIVNKPFVLLLDEPLSALDPHIRQEMQAELARFKK
jgi:spermidine/putrescine transport system ATP-binding protein